MVPSTDTVTFKSLSVALKKAARSSYLGLFIEKIIVRICVMRANTIFIHIPKCGGLSFSKSLYGFSLGHKDYTYFRPFIKAGREIIFIYRDPIERFQSAWNYALYGGTDDGYMDPSVSRLIRDITPEECLRLIKSGHVKDHIFRTQFSYIEQLFEMDDNDVTVTAINLKDLDKFMRCRGLKAEARNVGNQRTVALSEEATELIKEIYSMDYEIVTRYAKKNQNERY